MTIRLCMLNLLLIAQYPILSSVTIIASEEQHIMHYLIFLYKLKVKMYKLIMSW